MLDEPLSQSDARRLLREIIKTGSVRFTAHAEKQMEDRNLDKPDILNVLRCGMIYDPAEFENGTWRHRVETQKLLVVVAFRSEISTVVVTAWRKKQQTR